MSRNLSLELQDDDFLSLRDVIAQEAGIRLTDFKRVFLQSRLTPRLRELGINNFKDYIHLLKPPAAQKEEIGLLINQITTNETRFFRENHHFEYLKETYLPPRLPETGGAPSFRFWSAGCATGEEAYSLAMTLSEIQSHTPGMAWHILATDIDSQALNKAQAGLFPEKCASHIPPIFLKKFFLKGVDERSGWIKVRSSIRERITFEYFNLHKPKDLPWGPFDGIFCRNVLIYFLPQSLERILAFFHRHLKPGGVLFLGHSEILFGQEDFFKGLGRTIYVKSDQKVNGE
ncbi:MAG: protein-glutamate O-methyltransferase [Thermodesulfobacteriota bacterium]